MSYPFPERTRMKRMEVIGQQVDGLCASGTVTFDVNLPPGAFATGFTAFTEANDAAVVFKVTPYVDHDQTLLANSSFKFLLVGATTATTNVTIAITSTKIGVAGMVVPAGDQYGAAAPVLCVHGYQVEVGNTGSTGTWDLAFVATEI